MKKFILAIILLGTSLLSHSEVVPIIPNNSDVITHIMGDDGYVSVPLQFGFPFYGKTFTHSFMFDNGVIGLFDPISNTGCNPQNNFCGGQQWSAIQPNTNMGSQFSYMIAPLWADIAPNSSTKYYTQGTSEYQRYMWENIHEYYSGGSRLNTFGVELKSSGSIDAYYSLVNINSSNTFIGTIGDPSLNEWNTIAYYPYGTVLNQIQNWNIGNTGINSCLIDPLSSTTCPGYAEAYLNQQCSISALYNTSCPGYAVAYFNQQCGLNPLYNSECSGYAVAYLNYQCSINPLYSTTCEGYETAYYNQQCSLNTLYDVGCQGYEQAYLNYQCSISSLYSTQCPEYESAYFAQQCSLNGLYNKECPNYAEAYALANIVTPTNKSSVQENNYVESTNETSKIAIISDSTVNKIVTTTSTTTSPAVAVPIVPLVTSNTQTNTNTSENKTEEKTDTPKTETKSDNNSSSSNNSQNKTSQPTMRDQIAAKRREAAIQNSVKAGIEAASQIDSATSMNSQVAIQNIIIQAMGYTPGFHSYSYIIPDGNGYKPFSIYKNQKTVDNRLIEGGLIIRSDKLHQQLIQLQYEEK